MLLFHEWKIKVNGKLMDNCKQNKLTYMIDRSTFNHSDIFPLRTFSQYFYAEQAYINPK